jgi:ectoine hydroxylase-related dioxygenase (phytanoyl-CoA dioxygenase family)
MSTTQLPASDQIAAAYDRDGYWIEHALFTAKECDELKVEALRVLREKAKPGASVYVGVAAASPMYYRLASDPRIVSVLDKIMSEGVMFLSDKFVFKSGALKFATPWHYDYAYWQNTRPKMSVWIPLDDCSAHNGTLKVLPGSHKKAWKHESRGRSQTNNEFVNFIPDSQWKPEEEVTCELKRGSAIFFSDRTLHASCENTSGLDRYAIISTYHAPAEDEEFDKHFSARHVIVPRR